MILVLPLIVGTLSFTITYGFSKIVQGLVFGFFGLSLPIVLSDLSVQTIYRGDILLTARRINVISLFTSTIGGVLIILSSVIATTTFNHQILEKGILLAVLCTISMRLLVYSVFSDKNYSTTLMAILIQPIFLTLSIGILFPLIFSTKMSTILLSITLLIFGPLILLLRLGGLKGNDKLRMVPLFRSFILAWAEEYNEPLEEEISKFSTKKNTEVDILSFKNMNGECIGKLITPYIHPGPFRNVGSSGLSQKLTEKLSIGNCITLIAHGISNHEGDMASSHDLEKVIEAIQQEQKFILSSTCTPLIRVNYSGAHATCQLFEKTALVTLTLSPKSHDDIPDIVKEEIQKFSELNNLSAIVIDSHNCIINNDLLDNNDVENLIRAGKEAIRQAINSVQHQYSLGFNRINPKEWGINEGMGPCGIGIIIILINNQKYGYIVLDTNNAIQGLREFLVDKLKLFGFADAEILTSDTHLVNAVGATDRGYYPAGEVMNWDTLTNYIYKVIEETKLVHSSCAFSRVFIEEIKVIGENGLNLLRDVAKTGFSMFVRTALIVMPTTFLVATIVLYVL